MTESPKGLMSKWCAKRRQWIGKLLNGTHDHFMFDLPPRSGFVTWLLQRFYNGIVLDREQQDILRRLPPDAVLVYTTKFKSYFEYLFYHIFKCSTTL